MLWTFGTAMRTPTGGCLDGRNPHKVPINPNGNLTQKTEGNDTWGYEWNTEGLLTRVLINGSEVVRYSYDPIGRRVEKVTGSVVTTFAHDAEAIIREQSSAGPVLKYIHSPEIDEPLAVDDGGANLSFYHADALSNIVKTTNGAGAVTSSLQYNAFGVLELGTPGRYAFTGREWESESQLYYFRARYLDPRLGRFISEDPIGFEDGPNFFAYVGDNPVRYVDPWGLMKIVICQKEHSLTLYDDDGKPVVNADVVCGCQGTPTPTGTFTAGNWQKDKTNPKFSGPEGWSDSPWTNPYGPWFLPIGGSNGCGIHGTRGWSWLGDTFIDMPKACSHGCVRMSNPNIVKMHEKLPKPKGTKILIKASCVG